MKTLPKVLFTLFTAITISACASTNPPKERWIIASQTIDCVGVGPQKCLLIKRHENDNWQFFYSTIEGFDYVEGFEYTLEVSKKTMTDVPLPADAPSIRYQLHKAVEKTATLSQNLPQKK